MSTVEEQPTAAETAEPSPVEGNRPEDEPAPGQTKATEVETPPEPEKAPEPKKIPSIVISFDYTPEGNQANLVPKKPDAITYMDCAAIVVTNNGRKFTYRRNRID